MDRESRRGVVVVAALGLLATAISLAPDRVVACWRAVRSPGPELPFDNSELPANLVQWLWHRGHDDTYKVLVTAPNGETSQVSVERTALDPLTSPRPVIVGIDQYRVIEPLESGSELSFVPDDVTSTWKARASHVCHSTSQKTHDRSKRCSASMMSAAGRTTMASRPSSVWGPARSAPVRTLSTSGVTARSKAS